MHRIVTEHPDYVHITERRADLNRAKRTTIAAGTAWDQARDQERARHAAAVARAIDRGEPPPPAPTPPTAKPDVGTAINAIDAELGLLREEEAEFLANYGEELLIQLKDEERQLAKRAAPAVAKIRELVPEWHELATTAHQLARAAKIAGPSGPRVSAGGIVEGGAYVPDVPEPVGVPRQHPNGAYQERMRVAREKLANRRYLPPR